MVGNSKLIDSLGDILIDSLTIIIRLVLKLSLRNGLVDKERVNKLDGLILREDNVFE